jgi:carbon storage regulator CsrA
VLSLTRRPNQEIVIDERIRIVVTSVRGNQVRLGIVAAPDVHVRRGELRPLPGAGGQGPGAKDAA